MLISTKGILAQDSIANLNSQIILKFPVIEYPYLSYASKTVSSSGNPNLGAYFKMFANPSMEQSLSMSNDLYLATHYGFKQLFKKQKTFKRILFSSLFAASADLFYMYSPLGNGWLHEEYHRSVLTIYNINSFDDMNTFPFGKRTVSVNSVEDWQLEKMKLNSNPDFVRLMSAGIEGQYHQIQEMQKNNFYHNQDLPNLSLYWISTINSLFYVNLCTDSSANKLTDDMMNSEGSNIKKRDFTGLDLDAWTYDLFHPNEPYTNRGIHPSGVGVKRYIKPSDLNSEEITYLKKQGNLQFLNLLSPALFSFYRIKIKTDNTGAYYGNFAIRHLLTSFGSDISTNVMLQSPKRNYFFSYHLYQNYTNAFHGLELEIIDEPIQIKNKILLISPKIMLWTQPQNQLFKTSKSAFGGLVSLDANYPLSKIIFLNLSLSGKTNGWVMGNMYLKSNFTFSTGLRLTLSN